MPAHRMLRWFITTCWGTMKIIHPALDSRGKQLILSSPSTPCDLAFWLLPERTATAVPMSPMPAQLSGIPFVPWTPTPGSAGWDSAATPEFDEPPFHLMEGKAAAAGVAIIEPDGRVWLVSPSNQFGGYQHTLPKGRVDPGMSLRATAMREAYEETGLRTEITGFLTDSIRTLTHTRYYIGRRIGGCPSSMGWETQAVHLVPRSELAQMLEHSNDQPVLQALLLACT